MDNIIDILTFRRKKGKKTKPKSKTKVTPVTAVTAKSEKNKQTTSDLVLEYLFDNGAEFTHNDYKRTYVTVEGSTFPIQSSGFSELAQRIYFDATGKGMTDHVLKSVCASANAHARFHGKQEEVYLRTGFAKDGTIELDIGDDTGDCIRVSKTGYTITKPTLKFIQPNGMLPLPRPDHNGDVEELWDFVNVKDEADQKLLIGWGLKALIPGKPFPLAIFQGEQGTAKSTTMRFMRALTDPAKAIDRSLPTKEEDIVIAAQFNHVLSYDNLSGLHHKMSDAFCRVATGGSFGTRAHYTNGEEHVMEVSNPILLNGIDDLAKRGDLASRSVIIQLEPIAGDRVKNERDLYPEFEAASPRIFGGLLKGVVAALKNVDDVKLETLPRLADFVTWITAAEEGLGWETGSFSKIFTQSLNRGAILALQMDPFAPHLCRFLSSLKEEEWAGPASDLHNECFLMQNVEVHDKWLNSPSHLSSHLMRIATMLREIGVEVERPRVSKAGRSLIIRKTPTFDVTAVIGVNDDDELSMDEPDWSLPPDDVNYDDIEDPF